MKICTRKSSTLFINYQKKKATAHIIAKLEITMQNIVRMQILNNQYKLCKPLQQFYKKRIKQKRELKHRYITNN